LRGPARRLCGIALIAGTVVGAAALLVAVPAPTRCASASASVWASATCHATERNGLPVDQITKVSVLDPYFYK
jgi:hypothetical protein